MASELGGSHDLVAVYVEFIVDGVGERRLRRWSACGCFGGGRLRCR